jgi:mRNA deadenylase 3'-5' endonuclease subunit Ccr4
VERNPSTKRRWTTFGRRKSTERQEGSAESVKEKTKIQKKMPVIFFDEAHKLWVSVLLLDFNQNKG